MQEIFMGLVLLAYVLTGLNLVLAHRARLAAQHIAAEQLATIKKAFALHNCGAREEAIMVLNAPCGPAGESDGASKASEGASQEGDQS